ncbi:MAG: N-acetyltransferase, partial [Gammaproteobacteria bacterium]
MTANLHYQRFEDIDLSDMFFDSLKNDYKEFSSWFKKKGAEHAYTFSADGKALDGFLYLKKETGEIADVDPALPARQRLKIGTFKINPHGTRLGERFMKKVFDHAMAEKVSEIYV